MQVVIDGQQGKTVNGRVATMIVRLIERAELINQDVNLKFEFNCTGKKVRPTIYIFEDEISIAD